MPPCRRVTTLGQPVAGDRSSPDATVGYDRVRVRMQVPTSPTAEDGDGPWTSEEVPWSPGPAGGSVGRWPSSWPTAGFDTVATMRNPDDGEDLPAATAGRITVARLDVTDPDTYDLPDDLRVVVNNAGVDSDYLPVEHGNLDDWRALFETNVLGVVGIITAAIPVLRANRPGGDLQHLVVVDPRLAFRSTRPTGPPRPPSRPWGTACGWSWRHRASGWWRSSPAPSTPTCSSSAPASRPPPGSTATGAMADQAAVLRQETCRSTGLVGSRCGRAHRRRHPR